MKTKYAIVISVLIVFSSCEKLLFAPQPANTNMNNFELLWQLVNDKYCYFSEKRVNWDSIHAVYKTSVNNTMDSHTFFNKMSDMLAELKDGHVGITSNFDTSFYGGWKFNYPSNFNLGIVLSRYLLNKYNEQSDFLWKELSNSIGYIRYSSFNTLVESYILDTITSQFASCRGIIIDIRNNGGGDKTNTDIFTSYFTNKPFVAVYLKEKEGLQIYNRTG